MSTDEDMVVMLGDQGTDSTLLAPDSSTLPKPPLRHLSSLAGRCSNNLHVDYFVYQVSVARGMYTQIYCCFLELCKIWQTI